MSSTSPRKGGNPAAAQMTAKQKREAERQAKLAEYQRNIARRKRNKTLGWALGGLAAVVAVGVVVASIVFTPKPVDYEVRNGDLTADGPTGLLADVAVYENQGANHTEEPVTYDVTPPAGGPHSAQWLTCGVYTQQVPNENAVHSMEHGSVWITYDPAKLSAGDVDKLKSMTPRTYAILSPYEGMDTAIALSAWNAQLKLDNIDDAKITAFLENYWKSDKVPEPGALCSPPDGGWSKYGYQDFDLE